MLLASITAQSHDLMHAHAESGMDALCLTTSASWKPARFMLQDNSRMINLPPGMRLSNPQWRVSLRAKHGRISR